MYNSFTAGVLSPRAQIEVDEFNGIRKSNTRRIEKQSKKEREENDRVIMIIEGKEIAYKHPEHYKENAPT